MCAFIPLNCACYDRVQMYRLYLMHLIEHGGKICIPSLVVNTQEGKESGKNTHSCQNFITFVAALYWYPEDYFCLLVCEETVLRLA